MIRLLLVLMVATCLGALAMGCAREADADPAATVRELLALHGLLGQSPENRSETQRAQPVAPERLAVLLMDDAAPNPFLANLYVGFVVGALARHQDRLVFNSEGDSVFVQAGDARIVLRLRDGRYRIVLSESIPPIIRERALAQQRRLTAPPLR